jgi:acetyl-CoA synthetase
MLLVKGQLGSFAKPDEVKIVVGLPKTRSGKIMRRVLRKIAVGDINDLGDISTLADPDIINSLITNENPT